MKKKYLIHLLRFSLIGFLVCSFIPVMSQAQKDTTKSQKVQQVEIVTFKPGTSEANQHMVDASFRSAINQLPVVHTFLSVVGNDSENSGQVKHVYITTFNSKGDLTTYNASPQHQAVKKKNSAYIDNVITVDYPVGK
ncbi:MAG TPA: Dabb family protein [Puia sp.]